jgi:hypothetical protein
MAPWPVVEMLGGNFMIPRLRTAVVVVIAALTACACESIKSSNPLSPAVAGPIPGVNITVPTVLLPSAGTKIPVDQQPVTLMVQNAVTNGVRPLSYVFDVATDANFTNMVFTRDGIAPGSGGQTSVKLPGPLATAHTYYWRAHAQDGANTGGPSPAINFDVFTPIVINAPVLVSPAPNATTDSIHPKFTITDATRSGPVGAISYLIEVADSASFANKIAAWTSSEQPTQTVFDPPTDFAYSTVYFWHVRAFDPTTSGPFSVISAFTTLAQPVAPTPPPPTGGAPAAGDAINLAQATILNSPSDLGSWPVTTSITRLDLGSNGVHVEFSKRDGPGRWPDFTPPGWSGSLEYTLGMALNIGGRWYASAAIEFWNGLDAAGGPPSGYAQNWFYDPARWAPMTYHQPAVGEQIGFFVCAGDCRNRTDSSGSPVRERSNVVLVAMPSDSGASYTFAAAKTLASPTRRR